MTGRSAERLVALYPRHWRARYGDEFAHVLRAQRLTGRLVMDVIGGALDAHLARSRSLERDEGAEMTAKLMRRCAAGGPKLSAADAWNAGWLIIGAALVIAGAQVAAASAFGRNDYTQAFSAMTFPALMFVMTPALYMRQASRRARALFATGGITFLSAVAVLSVWI